MILTTFEGQAAIPEGIASLDAFCEWVETPEFPTFGQFSFLRDNIWLSYDMELLILQNLLKLEIASVLHGLTRELKLGYTFTDRAFFLRMSSPGCLPSPMRCSSRSSRSTTERPSSWKAKAMGPYS